MQTHRNATKAPLTGNRSTKPPPASRYQTSLPVIHQSKNRHVQVRIQLKKKMGGAQSTRESAELGAAIGAFVVWDVPSAAGAYQRACDVLHVASAFALPTALLDAAAREKGESAAAELFGMQDSDGAGPSKDEFALEQGVRHLQLLVDKWRGCRTCSLVLGRAGPVMQKTVMEMLVRILACAHASVACHDARASVGRGRAGARVPHNARVPAVAARGHAARDYEVAVF